MDITGVDIVYIVGHDKHHNYTELKYSIRSAEKYLKHIRGLVIVGQRPDFILPHIHLNIPDLNPGNTAKNIYEKILAAVNEELVSEDFICMSDDYFLLKEFDARILPYFYEGDIITVRNRTKTDGTYRPYVEATLNALTQRGLPTKYFNVHFPIKYNKKLFKEVMSKYDWNIQKSYISKSLYCNTLEIDGEETSEYKFRAPKTRTAISRAIKDRSFFSTNHHAINEPMIDMFDELYPNKSRWEDGYHAEVAARISMNAIFNHSNNDKEKENRLV